MHPKDLLKMLDLNGRHTTPTVSGVVVSSATATTPPADASPTALEVDEWGLRRGRDLIDESPRLRAAGTDAFSATDFFSAAFDPDPRLMPACRDALRHEFLTQLLDTPDYRALHTATHLNDTAAGIAAAHFAEQFGRLQQDDAAAVAPDGGREMAAIRAAGAAVRGADEEVRELHEAASALGLGPGTPGSNDPATVAALFQRVRSDPALKRICELAGRFRRVAQSRQRWKASHGLDDVVGVEPGGDVGRLLPSELAKLALPELELDTLRRIAERQALCREYHATEPVGKGPIIVSVDESGSMAGERVHTAKALALALAWVARQQRRWCGLIAYSGESDERLLALPPGRWDEAALCDWLAAFIGRGSTLDVPVREMPTFYRRLGAPAGVTDLVFVTDARCSIPAEIKKCFLDWKASAQVRLISLVLDESPGDLAAVSDEVHQVHALDPGGEPIGRLLSL